MPTTACQEFLLIKYRCTQYIQFSLTNGNRAFCCPLANILVFPGPLFLQKPVPHSLFVFFKYLAAITCSKIEESEGIKHQSVLDFLVKTRVSCKTGGVVNLTMKPTSRINTCSVSVIKNTCTIIKLIITYSQANFTMLTIDP